VDGGRGVDKVNIAVGGSGAGVSGFQGGVGFSEIQDI
jgi:hypothetical protein